METRNEQNSTAGSLSMYLSEINQYPLLTVEETLDALGRVGKVGYRQPGSQ